MNLNFVFKYPDHIRFESGRHVSGPHNGANRVIKVDSDPYLENNYLVTIYNADGNHPLWQDNVQMTTKQMRIMESNSNKIALRGWGNDSLGQSFENYGLTINIINGQVHNCILHLFDKSVDIKYLNESEINDPIESFNKELEQPNKCGVFTERRVDGEKIDWTYLNNQKHGEYKMYFSDGKIKEIGNWKFDKPDGDWKAYHSNGVMRAIGQYKEGNQTGLWKFYFENGVIAAEGNYINNQQKGKWIYYNDIGEIDETETF